MLIFRKIVLAWRLVDQNRYYDLIHNQILHNQLKDVDYTVIGEEDTSIHISSREQIMYCIAQQLNQASQSQGAFFKKFFLYHER